MLLCEYLVKNIELSFKFVKQRFLSFPCHNCTPMIPKTKNIRKDNISTLPSIGSVSKSSVTKIRMPAIQNYIQKESVNKY